MKRKQKPPKEGGRQVIKNRNPVAHKSAGRNRATTHKPGKGKGSYSRNNRKKEDE